MRTRRAAASPEAPVTSEGTNMTVNPEALGNPPKDADEYLKKANAEDPRSDPRAPAHEPGGQENAEESSRPGDPDPL
jgi:hypothetical protein